MMKIILIVVSIVYFGGFGLVSIIWPEKVRAYYFKNRQMGLNNFKNWLDVSRWEKYFPGARWFRFFGVLSLVSALLVVYAWVRG